MDKNVSYVTEVLNKLQMRKNNSYIAASFAYKDGEILTKTHIQLLPEAILKILSVCCAPTDPPKSPRPKFFFRYFRFFIFFRGFRALRSYAENRHQRRRRTSKIISVRPDSKGMSYIPISFRMINSCQNKYFKCIS